MPQQPESGSVDRTVDAEVFDKYVKPQQFGTVGAGGDDTAVFQEALTAIQGRGGRYTLMIPPDSYNIGGTLSYVGDHLSIDAEGATINKTSTTSNLFDVTGGHFKFSGGIIESNAVHTSGYAIRVTGDHSRVDDVLIYQCYSGIYFGGTQTHATNVRINSMKHHGIHYGPTVGGFVNIMGTYINGPENNSNDGIGLLFENGDTFTLANINVASHQDAIVVRPPSGKFVRNFFATNVLADGVGRTIGGDGWIFDATTSGSLDIRRVKLVNCWGSTMPDRGMALMGTNLTDVEIIGFTAVTNREEGLWIGDGCSHVRVIGGTFSGNSLDADGTYSGIKIEDTTDFVTIQGVHAGQTGGLPNSQRYGIEVDGLTHDFLRIIDNNTALNVVDEIKWGRWTGGNNELKPRYGGMPGYGSDAIAAAANYPRGGHYLRSTEGSVYYCICDV
jgi:hypothetical protein